MTTSFEEEAMMCSPMAYGDGDASSSKYGLDVFENRRSRGCMQGLLVTDLTQLHQKVHELLPTYGNTVHWKAHFCLTVSFP
jgi:hypothetical protein